MAVLEMTEEEFRVAVRAGCDGDLYPTLSEAKEDILVRMYRRADSEGRAVTDPDYVSTFEFDLAVAMAFQFRAGAVAAMPDARENEQSISASQIRAGLMAQAKAWRTGNGGRLGSSLLREFPLVEESAEIIVVEEL
jgi:hypothetical protein